MFTFWVIGSNKRTAKLGCGTRSVASGSSEIMSVRPQGSRRPRSLKNWNNQLVIKSHLITETTSRWWQSVQ